MPSSYPRPDHKMWTDNQLTQLQGSMRSELHLCGGDEMQGACRAFALVHKPIRQAPRIRSELRNSGTSYFVRLCTAPDNSNTPVRDPLPRHPKASGHFSGRQDGSTCLPSSTITVQICPTLAFVVLVLLLIKHSKLSAKPSQDIPHGCTGQQMLRHLSNSDLVMSAMIVPVQARGKFFYLDADHFSDKQLLAALTPDEPSAPGPNDKDSR